jgi:hypothetical protein
MKDLLVAQLRSVPTMEISAEGRHSLQGGLVPVSTERRSREKGKPKRWRARTGDGTPPSCFSSPPSSRQSSPSSASSSTTCSRARLERGALRRSALHRLPGRRHTNFSGNHSCTTVAKQMASALMRRVVHPAVICMSCGFDMAARVEEVRCGTSPLHVASGGGEAGSKDERSDIDRFCCRRLCPLGRPYEDDCSNYDRRR